MFNQVSTLNENDLETTDRYKCVAKQEIKTAFVAVAVNFCFQLIFIFNKLAFF